MDNQINTWCNNKSCNKKHKNNVGIEDILGKDDDGNEITIGDLRYDEDVNIENVVNDKLNSEKLDILIKKYLTEREYQIICLRYGLNGKAVYPQREVATMLGISRSYISRIEKKAIEILRQKIKRSDFYSY